jgi:hypothetical protein
MKRYSVYVAGGSYVTTVEATCITKACKAFAAHIKLAAPKIELMNKYHATLKSKENHTICSDYVVMEY